MQTKAIRFPTVARLYDWMRERLVKSTAVEGLELRQGYERVGKTILRRQQNYAHAKQSRRAARETKRLKTIPGQVARDIERKVQEPAQVLKEQLFLAKRLLEQQRDGKNKLYLIHEPLAQCIARGKAHQRYGFGCKEEVMRKIQVSIALVILIALLIALSTVIHAAELSFPEKGLEYLLFMDIPSVITATLTPKSSLTAPAAVTVVTEEEIKNSGMRNLADLLERVNGISMQPHLRTGNFIILRGITNKVSEEKFKLMIDGHAIVDPMWYSFTAYYNIGLENVKQVEIMRGPGSALFGTGAFAGVINVITKKPADYPGVKVDIKGGSFNTYITNLKYGVKYSDNCSLGLNLYVYETAGSKDLILEKDKAYGAPWGLTPGRAKKDSSNYNASINFAYKDLEIDVNYANNLISCLIPQLNIMTQNNMYDRIGHGYIEVNYNLPVTDTLSLRNTVSYDTHKFSQKGQAFPDGFDLAKSLGYPISLDINGDGIQEVWPDGGDLDFGYSAKNLKGQTILDNKFSETNQLLVGIFYENITTYDTYVKAEANPLYVFRVLEMTDFSETFNWSKNAKRNIYGAFAQDEWSFVQNWYLLIGGRYDRYSDFGKTLNPRLGLVWDYNQVGGLLKLLYGTAFRSPSFSELYQNNIAFVGNEDIKAEKLTSEEIIWQHIFMDKMYSNISVYMHHVKDLIDISTEPLYVGGPKYFINHGKWKNWGIELEEKYVFKKNNYIYIVYAYTHNKDETLNSEIPLIPKKHLGAVGFNIQPMEKLNWNTHVDYTDQLQREVEDTRRAVPASIVIDTSIRYDYSSNLEFQLSGFNITNQKKYIPSSMNDAPLSDFPNPNRRSFMVSASYKF